MSALVARQAPARLLPALGIAALGAAAVPLAVAVGEVSPKVLLAGLVAAAGLAALALAGHLKHALLFCFVVALTYNRQFYSFDWLHGDLGGRGLYWCPSDVFLLGLLILWPLERAVARATGRPLAPSRTGPSTAVWLLPLIAVATLSSLVGSEEPIGSLTEVYRYTKIAVLLVYLRHNLDRRTSLVAVAALGGVILMQAPISVLQVAFASGQNGLTQIFQTSEPSELARRAAGTLGHPNFLAPYLLLIVPPFAALGLGLWRTRLGYLCALLAGAGALTIVLSQSRAPIVLVSLAVVAIVGILTHRRLMPPLRAVALTVAAATLLVLATIPLLGVIEKRLVGDLGASVDFRAGYNEAAIRMWEKSPVLGVGPNNFAAEIRHFAADRYVLMTLDALSTDQARDKVHLRSVAPVHNVYLLIASEQGFLGLCAFLLFLGRAVLLSWRASRRAPAVEGLFATGVLCGLLAEAAQQQLDYSMMWDPLLSTLALLVGLCQSIAAQREGRP